ncbi:hypothetical protein [Marinimicrobium sp. ABcell2]|uniref:hypothetical protein n=1 Tax=Marinimicrobium sp. ABcell2 TaxID=3069751 RepID=UPI0027B80FC5|nr:hypothetical protein [Marinimicrobium sp. ABcell2]MDQ2077011.1 hypothetical protein [Marinimicrobium sp. ABcell2]
MVMKPETMNDILEITQKLHRQLADNLVSSADQSPPEREKLLLEYLSEHEDTLARTLDTFQKESDLGPLDTWFYTYTDRHNIVERDLSKIPFGEMDTGEIAAEIANLHDQLIDLYSHLYERAESDSARKVLSQLLDVEKSKGKLISYESGQSGDF